MTHSERSLSLHYGVDVNIDNPNVRELLTKGYRFNTELLNDTFLDWRGKVEYHFAEIVYFVSVDTVEIASLSVNSRYNNQKDPFWNELQIARPDLSDSNLLACYIQGIVVHPLWRNNGTASELLSAMTEYYQPAVILGQTKTPEAVAARSKVLSELGYRTFYGFHEVTPGAMQRDNIASDFINAALKAEHFASKVTDQGTYIVDPDILPAYMPDTSHFAPEIQRAFEPIIRVQKSVGQLKTAASVLVSVNNAVLPIPTGQ